MTDPSAANETTVFHLTHWKAGSQWVRGVFQDACAGRFVDPTDAEKEGIFSAPIQAGKIYSPLYLTRRVFESSPAAQVPHRKFLVIRDLRDTLVSWYFSLRYSHPANGPVDAHRAILQSAPTEQGLLHLLNHQDFYALSMIHSTWRGHIDLVVRYEDLLADPHSAFARIFAHCGLDTPELTRRDAVDRAMFEQQAGRARGQEDPASHFRKGIAGDWKNHFTPALGDAFNIRYGNLLVQLGYEKNGYWTRQIRRPNPGHPASAAG